MTCKKCAPSGLYRGILCVHCGVDANNATIIRRNMYGAAKYAGASFARVVGGTGKPLAALVLAQKTKMATFDKQQRAILAQDIRRARSAILPSVGSGTPQERVVCELQAIASRAADSVRGGSFLKPGNSLYVKNVFHGKAAEPRNLNSSNNDAAENRLEAATGNDAMQRAAMAAMVNRPQYFGVVVSLGELEVWLDVEIDASMPNGNEFRFSKQRYHAQSSHSKPTQPSWTIPPVPVGRHLGHEQCAECRAIEASQVLKQFEAAFALASVKTGESENARLRRELQELEHAVPRG